jgi:acyl carrier protein
MRKALDQVLARFGTINGVIHAAGIVQAGLIQTKTRESAEAVLAPKVDGTMILWELLQHVKLDFMVLLSSISSVLTPYGLSDYSAASSFLDAFANFANTKGCARALSINYSGWREVGMFAELETLNGAEGWEREAELQNAIAPKDGLEAFERAFNSNLPQIVVSPQDLNKLLQGEANRVVREVETQPEGADEPADMVEKVLTQVWSSVFGLDRIGLHEQFAALGGHSLMAMQIVSRIRSLYQVPFTLRDFFESPSVAQLSSVIQARILAEIEGLTDEQARQLISND